MKAVTSRPIVMLAEEAEVKRGLGPALGYWHNMVYFEHDIWWTFSAVLAFWFGLYCDHQIILKAEGPPGASDQRQFNAGPNVVYFVGR
jgi:hypothetical protein